jgi:chaperonin GroEL
MSKEIYFGDDFRTQILKGAEIFAKTVTRTMGPFSGTVMMNRMGGLLQTKDGVTVAREIHLPDPVANMGCQVLKEACIKVNDEAGDGTTTTACLTNAILREAHKMVAAGHCPMKLQRELLDAMKKVVDVLWENAYPVEEESELHSVAMISCNGDREVADVLTEACLAVGKDGTVVIEEGNGLGIDMDFKEGFEISCGAVSRHFMNDALEKKLVSPLVAVVPKVITSMKDVFSMLEESSQFPQNELLLICYGLEGEALKFMTTNHVKGVCTSMPINIAGVSLRRAEYMKDIAALCGCAVLEEDQYDITKFNTEWFGSCMEVLVQEKNTVFTAFDEAEDTIEKRVTELQNDMASAISDYDRDDITKRISKLKGGFCLVSVGGHTELAMKEKRARIEDALGAVQSALKTGIVAGGGASYLWASQVLSDKGGEGVLKRALRKPMQTIIENASENGDFAVEMLLRDGVDVWHGWDARKKEVVNLYERKIIDPLLVAEKAVESSVSVAALMITAEAGIV